jgi:uncharacterized oligopeptide transporter (OPT) family protein
MEEEFDNSYCLFCSKNIISSRKNLTVKMHKVLERKGNKVTYLPINVQIPRCNKCASIHLLTDIIVYTVIAVSFIGMLFSPLASKIADIIYSWNVRVLPGIVVYVMLIIPLLIPGIIVGVGLGYLIPLVMHVKNKEYHKSHPLYKLAIEEGYKDGKKPK